MAKLIRITALILTFILILPAFGCATGNSSGNSDAQEDTQAMIDDNYGKGLSFAYTDYADNVMSLNYNLKQNAAGNWQLSVSGQNAHVNGTKVISADNAAAFFYFLIKETGVESYKGYNKTDDEITSDTAWWFNLDVYYEKDSIVAYGYMMHPDDYDDLRIQITEYLNNLFKAA